MDRMEPLILGLPKSRTAILHSGQSNFKFEYLGEFMTEFENILGYESEAQMGLIDEKNQRSKISCYCPFKDGSTARLLPHKPHKWQTPRARESCVKVCSDKL